MQIVRLTLDERLALLVGEEPAPRSVVHRSRVPVRHLRLVPSAPGPITERRRFDCIHLDRCEDDWCVVHEEAQAECPGTCAEYTPT